MNLLAAWIVIFQALEPWLVSEVKISGDLQLISVLASSLPTSEDSEHVIDLEALKSPPLSSQRRLDLIVGVFSTANNFKRRMAVRRTWMQYPAVRSGAVAVRFFVGLVSLVFVYTYLLDFPSCRKNHHLRSIGVFAESKLIESSPCMTF